MRHDWKAGGGRTPIEADSKKSHVDFFKSFGELLFFRCCRQSRLTPCLCREPCYDEIPVFGVINADREVMTLCLAQWIRESGEKSRICVVEGSRRSPQRPCTPIRRSRSGIPLRSHSTNSFSFRPIVDYTSPGSIRLYSCALKVVSSLLERPSASVTFADVTLWW